MTKNVEMTLAASGCVQCVWPVDVVTGCIQSVVDLLDYLIMKYPYSFISVLFFQPHPYFLYNFSLKKLYSCSCYFRGS